MISANAIANVFDFLLKSLIKLLIRLFPNVHPNYYTLGRIFLIPPTIICLLTDYYAMALSLFIFGAFLDILDGPVARYTKKTSRTGAFLDPFADKLFFLSVITVFFAHINKIFFFAVFSIEVFFTDRTYYQILLLSQTRRANQKRSPKILAMGKNQILVWNGGFGNYLFASFPALWDLDLLCQWTFGNQPDFGSKQLCQAREGLFWKKLDLKTALTQAVFLLWKIN